MSAEADILAVQVKALEKELKAARKTLRDEFAMAALPEAMRQTEVAADAVILEEDVRAMAIIAYGVADAMLEVRQ